MYMYVLFRDSDEWVRLFASVLAPFPDSQAITLEADSNASEILEEIENTCELQDGACDNNMYSTCPHRPVLCS